MTDPRPLAERFASILGGICKAMGPYADEHRDAGPGLIMIWNQL